VHHYHVARPGNMNGRKMLEHATTYYCMLLDAVNYLLFS